MSNAKKREMSQYEECVRSQALKDLRRGRITQAEKDEIYLQAGIRVPVIVDISTLDEVRAAVERVNDPYYTVEDAIEQALDQWLTWVEGELATSEGGGQ